LRMMLTGGKRRTAKELHSHLSTEVNSSIRRTRACALCMG
jgi:hypothetical protein